MVFQYWYKVRVDGFLLELDDLIDLLPAPWRAILDLKLLEEIQSNLDAEFLPEAGDIFRALQLPPEQVRVVIVGQDPYPNPNHAMGLAFSVKPGTYPLPASLRNIFTELENDLGYKRSNGDLSDWSAQGVLLLNRTLTVAPFKPGSHQRLGWERFTRSVVEYVAKMGAIGILWGKQAFELSEYFKNDCLITAAHPSPLSAYRGFFGSRPFSNANSILAKKQLTPIKW